MVHFQAKAATGEKPRCTCIQAPGAAYELHMCQVHAHDVRKHLEQAAEGRSRVSPQHHLHMCRSLTH